MNKFKAHMNNIAFSHTIFALPFAYIGAILAVGGIPTGWELLWITLAMVGARSAAMALNQMIDLKYDVLQPRFAKRPMVTGEVKPWEAVLLTLFSLALFFVAASNLHPICIKLAPLAVIPLAVYPYMKRFSWTCHFVLGLALSIAPIGAWMAINGQLTLPITLIGLAVGVWIGGFDIIYGCQDVEFDKKNGLHSVPVRFGVEGALKIARSCHAFSIVAFTVAGQLLNLQWVYYCGVIVAAVVLIYQHLIVRSADFSKVTQTYFMRNGLVSIALLIFTIINMIL